MIGIVILNFNSWDLTVDCIESIEKSIDKNYKIYVVDNLSSEKMTERFNKIKDNKSIKFIQASENRGYSAGNNIGLKEAIRDGCEYFLITNSDIIFHEYSIEKMKEYLLNNDGVGIVGPKVLKPDGKVQDIDMLIETTLSVKYSLILQKTPLRNLIKNKAEGFSKKTNDLSESFQVHSVSGCCFMMNKMSLELMYPLDEVPFLYEEEVILGIKMEQFQLKTVYLLEARVTHFHGQTTKDLKAFSYIEFIRSEIYYLKKYQSSKNNELFFLIMIRLLKYFINMFKYKDYRVNFKRLFSRGLEFIWKGIY